MGLQRLEFGVRVRKFMVISVKICYRSVWNHPFLVGLVCFLILLYRSFPLLFSVLVTASPVLVCTAVLLGALLSFGSPNIPETDEKEEEKVSHEVSPLKTGATEDDIVVERDVGDDDFVVERHVGKRWDIVENTDERVSLADNEASEGEEDDGSVHYKPLVDEDFDSREEKVSHEVSPLKTGATEDDIVVERGVGDDDFVVERHVGKRWDTVENADERVSLVDNEVSEVEEDDGSVCYKLLVDEDFDSRDIHCENGVIDEVDRTLNESLVEKEREIREEMLVSEGVLNMGEAVKDRHLLADEVHDGNHEVEDVKFAADLCDDLDSSLVLSWKRTGDDEDDGDGGDNDDESLDSGSDGAESSSPDASMADIIPILDELHPLLGSEAPQPAQLSHDGLDAASVSSHGSSNDESVESDELENQGEEDNDEEEDEGEGAKGVKDDESKSAIKWTEDDQKNLMDVGTSELERNQRLENLIARRRVRENMRLMAEKNLIDLDSADIPLNITAISTKRRNPFDLPYDSYDDLGLPPLPGSAPSSLQPRRNPFDLPYDSSEEKPDLKGDSFQREFSGFNQRETVSQREAFFRRHESFNIGTSSLSVPWQEFKWKPYFVPERLVTEGASPSSFQRQSSEVSESKLSSVPDSESVSSVVDEEDNKTYEQDVSQETERILNEDHASVHAGQESQLSGDVESVDVDQTENRDVHHDVVEITLGDGESQLEMESSLSEAGATTHVDFNASEIHPRIEPVEEDNSTRSSLSSLSEIDEKLSDVKGEGSAVFVPRDHGIKESGNSTQPSFEESEFHFTSRVVDDNQHRAPVYDLSPSSVKKFLSFSSVSSDTQAEISEMGSPSMLVESTDKEPERHGETTEQGTSNFQEMHAASSDLLNENVPRARDLPEIGEHGVTYAGLSGVSSTSADHNVSMVPESVVEYVSTDAELSSFHEGLEEDFPNKEESFTQNQVDLLSFGAEMTPAVDQGMGEVLDSSPEEQQHPMRPCESSEAEPVDRHAVDKEEGIVMPEEEIIWTERDQMHSSNFDASPYADGHYDKGEELSSTALTYQHMPSNDVSLSTAEDSDQIVVAQVSQVHPSEANLREEHKKDSEMDQVLSPSSDSKIGTGLDCDMNVEGIPSNSRYQDMPSRENELEKQLSRSDKSTDEQDKLEEPSTIATESRGEVDIVNNEVNVHKVNESEDKFSINFSSMTSESTSPAESPEHTLPTDQKDLKDKILNEIESEGPKEVPEHFNYAAEVYATHVDEENISEEEDEIKEIDEGILSELDSIGDFNVKEIGLPKGSHVAYTESALLPEYIKTETNVKLPVLEAKSVEDIDLAFKQLHEGVDVEEVILPSMIENQQDHADTNSKLPVVEARSLEDICSAFQQGPESNPAELPHSSDLRNGSSEVQQHDVVSAKEIEVSDVVSGIKENSENAAGEPKNQYEEASEKTSLNLEGKKAKSHDSSSSSSSSSSDSE